MTEQQIALSASGGRSPRSVVRVNGAQVPGWIGWRVTEPTYFEAATFRLTFAVNLLPAAFNLAWWGTQTSDIMVEILAGLPADPRVIDPSQMTTHILGRVDEIEYDARTQTLELEGRDYAGAFIDNKLLATYQGQKAYQIVESLAAARGIPATVTPTTEKVGALTAHEPVAMSVHQSEWDLICTLARLYGFVAYVTPSGLYWGPDLATQPGALPYTIPYGRDPNGMPVSIVESLQLARNMTVARGVVVKVLSYSLKSGKPFTTTYPFGSATIEPGQASPWGPSQLYTYILRGSHSPADAQAYAQAKYREIIAHEMRLTATLPGDDVLTRDMPIALQGTGTQWDQTYYVQCITRSMDMEAGYVMTVEAKNQAADANPAS